ncbi:MAG TPA: hypothetical protein VD710_06390 [Nitrososphaeraceae archaeon]|nr:hypothetical protein [Nitrososphaeraceae archaeon]
MFVAACDTLMKEDSRTNYFDCVLFMVCLSRAMLDYNVVTGDTMVEAGVNTVAGNDTGKEGIPKIDLSKWF